VPTTIKKKTKKNRTQIIPHSYFLRLTPRAPSWAVWALVICAECLGHLGKGNMGNSWGIRGFHSPKLRRRDGETFGSCTIRVEI
jgi:hypothetical protein